MKEIFWVVIIILILDNWLYIHSILGGLAGG